jgi:diacylglycerol kinase (ATP)
MAKISIYFNDASSRAMSSTLGSKLENYLYRHDVKFNSPNSIEELHSTLQNDVNDDYEYIFSVGGDGTANTILQNIQGTKTKLMVIPTGTANDFATELGIELNVERIMKIFLHKTYQNIDVLKINDKFMLSNGGLGITSNVAKKINLDRKRLPGFKKLMKLTGSKIYPLYFAKELLGDFKRYQFHIESKDFPFLDKKIEASIVMINNQPRIGGNFLIAPETKNNDGKFNITILTHTDRLKLINATLMMMKGDYPKNDPEIISFETDFADITVLNDELTFFGDGEILTRGKSFIIKNIPNSLNVCSYDNQMIYCNSFDLEDVELMR